MSEQDARVARVAEQAVSKLMQAVVHDKRRMYYGTAKNPGAYVDRNVEDARQAVLAMMKPADARRERDMSEIREYTEGYPVEIVEHNGRTCLRARNEGGNNEVIIDLHDILAATSEQRVSEQDAQIEDWLIDTVADAITDAPWDTFWEQPDSKNQARAAITAYLAATPEQRVSVDRLDDLRELLDIAEDHLRNYPDDQMLGDIVSRYRDLLTATALASDASDQT